MISCILQVFIFEQFPRSRRSFANGKSVVWIFFLMQSNWLSTMFLLWIANTGLLLLLTVNIFDDCYNRLPHLW